MKPHLQLYIGHYVSEIVKGELPWQWGIRLDNAAEIRNKDRRETFVPHDIVGARVTTIMLSEKDTTILFSNGVKWSLNPTQYAIYDPRYSAEGEAYPQWPEELEEDGIPSHPEEDVSAKPDDAEAWEKELDKERRVHAARQQSGAQEFLSEEE